MSALIDSCLLIDHLLGRAEATAYLRSAPDSAISQITWVEVMVGARNPDEEALLRSFLSGFEVLPVDHAVAEEAVRLRRAHRLKLPDALILATARVHHLTLATRNTRDFAPDTPGVLVPYTLALSSP